MNFISNPIVKNSTVFLLFFGFGFSGRCCIQRPHLGHCAFLRKRVTGHSLPSGFIDNIIQMSNAVELVGHSYLVFSFRLRASS